VPSLTEATLNDLIAQAKDASKSAYCPYSRFPVGAAVLSKTGDIYAGCNVENASYGLTICAERNAVFQMVARGKQTIAVLVIYTPTQQPASPCGACRQVMNEFGPQARVISVCDGPDRIDTTVDKLLPGAFGPTNLV
jgi:cytidine deaminase